MIVGGQLGALNGCGLESSGGFFSPPCSVPAMSWEPGFCGTVDRTPKCGHCSLGFPSHKPTRQVSSFMMDTAPGSHFHRSLWIEAVSSLLPPGFEWRGHGPTFQWEKCQFAVTLQGHPG